MESFILFQAISHYIPQEYFPPIVLLLGALVAFEQWLASTNRIKANSTLQMIVNLAQAVLAKMKEKGK